MAESVVFDISSGASPFNFVVFIFICLIGSLGLFGVFWRARAGVGFSSFIAGYMAGPGRLVWPGIFLAVALLLLSSYAGNFWRLRSALSGAATTEGCIERFHPSAGIRGDDFEMIELNGREFHYTGSDLGPSYHKTMADGGLIRPDSWVRIKYVGNDIVYLEVRQHACRSAFVDINWRID